MKGTSCARELTASMAGPSSRRARLIQKIRVFPKNCFQMQRAVLKTPNPNMAMLMTVEPKWDQPPIANTRMMKSS